MVPILPNRGTTLMMNLSSDKTQTLQNPKAIYDIPVDHVEGRGKINVWRFNVQNHLMGTVYLSIDLKQQDKN